MKSGETESVNNSTDCLSSRAALWTFLSSSADILSGPAASHLQERRERRRTRRVVVILLESRPPMTTTQTVPFTRYKPGKCLENNIATPGPRPGPGTEIKNLTDLYVMYNSGKTFAID